MYSIERQLFSNLADYNVYNYQKKALAFDKQFYQDIKPDDNRYIRCGDGYFDDAEFSAFLEKNPDAPIDFKYKSDLVLSNTPVIKDIYKAVKGFFNI